MLNMKKIDGENEDDSPIFRIDSPTTISAAASVADDTNSYSSDDDDGDGYEFAFAVTNQDAVTADEIFANGKIRPVYPVFDRSLLLDDNQENNNKDSITKPTLRRLPLHKLFIKEERENRGSLSTSTSSSSEVDELDGVAPGSYCVWDPKSSPAAVRCKKSGSTGSSSSSSLKLRLRELVRRSQSDGKEKFMFIPVDNSNSKGNVDNKGKTKITGQKIGGGGGGGGVAGGRKTFLPYKQDLIGFFASVNTISRTHHPF